MNEREPIPPARKRILLARIGYLVAIGAAATLVVIRWNRHEHHVPTTRGRAMSSQEFLALFQGVPDTLPSYLVPYHQNEEFREAFPRDVAPPRMDTSLDLQCFSLEQIRYLRAFVLARHGFLFKDMVLRAFFNRFAWYQPIWIPETFQPRLSPWEQRWHNRLLEREEELARGNYFEAGGVRRAAIDHMVNRMLFDSIPAGLSAFLDTAGFAILEGKHRQLWNVYDKNQYDGIPSIVTTDLYIQLLHMRFKYLVKKLERDHLVRDLGSSLDQLHQQLAKPQDGVPRESVDEARSVVALALAFLRGAETPLQDLPEPLRSEARADYLAGTAGTGFGSATIHDTLFDWSLLVPRGHYASSDTLEHYFRAFKWIGTARWPLSPASFPKTLALARAWSACGPEGPEGLARISNLMGALSGPPNGLSPQDLVDAAREAGHADLLLDYGQRTKIVDRLVAKDPTRIRARGGNTIAAADLARPSLRIFPLRWSGDAEILQRLVNLERDGSGSVRRPFPSGLDVLAAGGDELARKIVLESEGLDRKWPSWRDTLSVLQRTSELRQGGDFHSRRIRLLGTLTEIPPKAPPFQQTSLWQRHLLVTRLAGWTLQKQENILYQEQAQGAECGEGGGPPPPDPMGWVDPNPAFWNGAAHLVRSLDSLLQTTGFSTERDPVDSELLEDFAWLGEAATRELEGKALTPDQLQRILWIGGHVESLTFRTTEIEPQVFDATDEALSAAATDVYSYNGAPLMEGTGYADELWALVEIGGFLHLARGAVLSHREWIGRTRLTDKQWHRMLDAGQAPPAPPWQAPLFPHSRTPGTVPTTSGLLPGGGCI